MRSKLEPDDMEVGMYITVLTGRKYTVTHQEFTGPLGLKVRELEKEDHSFKGDVLKIVTMDLPYIVVYLFDLDTNCTLDTRMRTFTRLSKEYVKSVIGDER